MREIFRHQIQRFNTTYFIDHNTLDEPIEYSDIQFKKPKFKFRVSNSFESENEYIKNYGNPLCSIMKEYALIVVNSSEEKLSIKIFTGRKKRREGVCWFSEKKSFCFLTVNKKNGDFYYGWNDNYNKKKSKTRFRKNCHTSLPILRISEEVKKSVLQIGKNYHPEKILEELFSVFFKDLNISPGNHNIDSDFKFTSKDYEILKYYLEKKKIKYPNNFGLFYLNPDIKIPFKTIKKCDMKLVDAFMKQYGLEGRSVRSAIHKSSRLNFKLLRGAYYLFDKSWINSDEDLLVNIFNFNQSGGYYDLNNLHLQKMSKIEQKKVFMLFKSYVLLQKIDLWTFWDHIRMYNSLKDFGEVELKWKSQDNIGFREEHLDWTDKLEFYKKGEYYRVYPNFMYEIINKEIYLGEEKFYPVLLDTTKNYNDESNIQFNCVKGYIGRSSSIIISLRRNEKNSSDRATVEYSLSKLNDEISVHRIQFLGKYNSRLSEDWEPVLLRLDQRVLSCINNEKFDTVKIKKICSNGVEMFSDSDWNEAGKLRWTYKNIE